eukprot:CAMPEP_0115275152 /NCGR_PEP_ID=MMETSP0270-20121206/56051_1 /TAXON_ID=71861 /ORGANISM="Scrippsiella trochoidea, Strain CCMP3099" /LENGTH=72 /DNA_ID=CAMNT_0002691701 /DNA_START=13 /DNA_END=227 /DNA_ORIENTATION=+
MPICADEKSFTTPNPVPHILIIASAHGTSTSCISYAVSTFTMAVMVGVKNPANFSSTAALTSESTYPATSFS